MKLDIGTLVYILIGIGSVIVSIYNKNKKHAEEQARRQASSDETEQQEHDWEFDEATVHHHKPEPVVVPSPPNAFQQYAAEHPKPKISSLSHSNLGAVNEEAARHYAIQKPDDELDGASVDISNFELAQAVVYAEIMNRKYF